MNDLIHRTPGPPRPTPPTGNMSAEKNAEHADRAARETSADAGSPALDTTAEEAVWALRRFLRAFAVARIRDDNVETVPDELVRTAAQLLQEVASTEQPDQDPADDNPDENSLPAAPPVRSLAYLTNREKAVAMLVRRGLTNQEIADELFLSTKTVEYHLTNIYHKLQVKSRRELRRLLELPR